MKIGRVIKQLRKANHMTQAELAAKVKFSQPMLSQLENESKGITMRQARILARVFRMPVPVFFALSLSDQDIEGRKNKAAYKRLASEIIRFYQSYESAVYVKKKTSAVDFEQ